MKKALTVSVTCALIGLSLPPDWSEHNPKHQRAKRPSRATAPFATRAGGIPSIPQRPCMQGTSRQTA